MRFVLLYHSLASDWNHGNAHFLRGIVRELTARGHSVRVLEPQGGWSRSNLVQDHGEAPLAAFARRFPEFTSIHYEPDAFDPQEHLDGADVVIMHEWTDPQVAARIARHRIQHGRYLLLFHDTHHRAVTAPETLPWRALEACDGILAFGEALRQVYLRRGWDRRAWTWHEAADTAVFRPQSEARPQQGELIWIGNWGDGERSEELSRFLIEPVVRLRMQASVYGVRYPAHAVRALARAGVRYRGWLPNHEVPGAFSAHRMTVHIPRRPYVAALPGIPTIRVFEALACAIPLVSAPWPDAEGLFGPDCYLRAANADEMAMHLRALQQDADLREALAANGLRDIRERHSCRHRTDQLLAILHGLRSDVRTRAEFRVEGAVA